MKTASFLARGAFLVLALVAAGCDGTCTDEGCVELDAGRLDGAQPLPDGARPDGRVPDGARPDGALPVDAGPDGGPDSGPPCEHEGVPGCVIDGVCLESGARNAENDCRRCDPMAAEMTWTFAPDDEACVTPDELGGACERDPFGLPRCCAGWTSVAALSRSACALRANGVLWCWGDNEDGLLGFGDIVPMSRLRPDRVDRVSRWLAVAAGHRHVCAIRDDRTLWCWGSNDYGQHGMGDTFVRELPRQVGTGMRWAAITAGFGHTCGLLDDGSAWCWGDNSDGQLGTGDELPQLRPFPVDPHLGWVSIHAASFSTCGVRMDGSLWCWGRNDVGQLGIGSTDTHRTRPTRVGTDTNWASITGGSWHRCGVRTDGTLWCWGGNRNAQLGQGDTPTERRTPGQVGTDTDWIGVAAGDFHTCGTRRDGTLWCWGDNRFGQLGLADTMQRSTPARVGTSTRWTTHVAGGDWFTCAIQEPGTLWCWGHNGFGKLGVGDTMNRTEPARLACPAW